MEENENENPTNENSKPNSSISMNSNNNISTFSLHDAPPLFSTIVTLYILILLYFPSRLLFKTILSPILIITLLLLLSLLRFGATQKQQEQTQTRTRSSCTSEAADQLLLLSDSNNSHDPQDHKWACTETRVFNPDPRFEDSFVEWNVRAPLEVIYEAYEEGEGEETEGNHLDPTRFGIERYPSLSLYYPESDSDCSSNGDYAAIGEWGTPESVSHRWEDEDRDGLIEIALDGVNNNNDDNNNNGRNSNKREMELDFVENFHGEEENNLIEIDISGVKHEEKWRFTGES